MPKLERLVKLARLKRAGEKQTVPELSLACGVSQRTIYRYLRTLSEIDLAEELQCRSRSLRSPRRKKG